MSVIGLAIGLAGAVVLARTMRTMLYGVPQVDVLSLAATAAMLLAVATVAAAVPARRAVRVSPTEALRGD
jgi:ABC-type antimicrobial peptide transport system permease subunit